VGAYPVEVQVLSTAKRKFFSGTRIYSLSQLSLTAAILNLHDTVPGAGQRSFLRAGRTAEDIAASSTNVADTDSRGYKVIIDAADQGIGGKGQYDRRIGNPPVQFPRQCERTVDSQASIERIGTKGS